MKQSDISLHVQGTSQFIDDIATPDGTLFACPVKAPAAHGRIIKTNIEELRNSCRTAYILTYKDIPGHNQVGHIIADEPLLAEDIFIYTGQPVAIVVAETQKAARKIAKSIKIEFEPLPAVFDPREAYEKNLIIGQERIFTCGDIDEAWDKCAHIFEGRTESGAQEHLYMETQSILAIPYEHNRMRVMASTQSPTGVQSTIAEVLGIPMGLIEVDVARLGGGFGGKENQASQYAALAALSAYKLQKPVKMVLSRMDDIQITGKRHPYSADFKIGLSGDFRILAFRATYYQNAGACADLSPSILERTMLHITNSYYIPNIMAKGISCRTNLPSNTAFRGFGGPQAMFVIESAIYKAASALGVLPMEIQKKNLIKNGQAFPYGMIAQNNNSIKCWNEAEKEFRISAKAAEIENFNSINEYVKKGFAVMPICFGISFTSAFLNQASALVHIYYDGSISISTGAVEMGQGISDKLRLIASRIFSVPTDRIFVNSTNTTRNANTSPTAASTGTDLNGNALRIACREILDRLKVFLLTHLCTEDEKLIEIIDGYVYLDGIKTEIDWNKLIDMAYKERINLSSHAFYATPGIYFDREKSKGNPFAYHVTGTAVVQVLLDCRRGVFNLDSVEVIHDAGQSIDEAIDLGQIEGGILQGIGWMGMEEIKYSDEGRLMSNTFSTYKVPDIYSVPDKFDVRFLKDEESQLGVMGAKATGEPPLMYGIGMYFAVLQAMQAFEPDIKPFFDAPLTNEKILLNLYSGL